MILNNLTAIDKAHWELHLRAVAEDTPSLKREVQVFLDGAELPKLGHPADIHNWLEKPEMRLEKLNG